LVRQPKTAVFFCKNRRNHSGAKVLSRSNQNIATQKTKQTSTYKIGVAGKLLQGIFSKGFGPQKKDDNSPCSL